jgi:hypothetical protein
MDEHTVQRPRAFGVPSLISGSVECRSRFPSTALRRQGEIRNGLATTKGRVDQVHPAQYDFERSRAFDTHDC